MAALPDQTTPIYSLATQNPKEPNIVGANGRSPLQRPQMKPRSLGSFIAGFKSSVTKRIRDELNETGIWQRNYYERIIRNERELEAICRYIESNPLNWSEDDENPAKSRKP